MNWYEIVPANRELTQGDLIFDCPVPVWKSQPIDRNGSNLIETLRTSYEFLSADLVVLTQACDLEHGHVQNVTLCPHLPLSDFKIDWEEKCRTANQNPTPRAWNRVCDDLNKGYIWNQTLLKKSDLDEFDMDFRVVDFYQVFTLPKIFIETLTAKRGLKRLRLLPPYREHVSQAFARFYMRVGLPTDIKLSDLS